MSSRERLGEFEQIVLLAVLRLGDNAYGVPVRQEIEKRTKRSLTVGALYRTLDRLEAKGYDPKSIFNPHDEGAAKRACLEIWLNEMAEGGLSKAPKKNASMEDLEAMAQKARRAKQRGRTFPKGFDAL